MTSLEKTIKVPTGWMDYRDKRVVQLNKGVQVVTNAMLARVDCEVYEYVMIQDNIWGDFPGWQIDGYSDKYGAVDVKVIEKYWNIAPLKVRHIFRQRNAIDHYYFIEKINWPEGLLVDGDEITIGFLGVMTWDEVADSIEPSRYNGMYVDVRKKAKVSSNLGE